MSECGNHVGGMITSTTTILVLYILLVIILKTFQLKKVEKKRAYNYVDSLLLAKCTVAL